MFNLEKFNVGDMVQCTTDIKKIGGNATDMDSAAFELVDYFYQHLTDAAGDPACALIRFFQTKPFESLTTEESRLFQEIVGSTRVSPRSTALVLISTRGQMAQWNAVRSSAEHRVIPLLSEELVSRMPMISQLVNDLGISVRELLTGHENILQGDAEKSYNLFWVPEALGSKTIPAQESFVIPFGIKSVLGFGSMLPSGNMFAIIMFSKVPINKRTADMFKSVSVAVNLRILRFDPMFARSRVGSELL